MISIPEHMATRIIEVQDDNFNKTLTPGSIKGAMSAGAKGSRDLWNVKREYIRVMPGFNVREDTPEYRAHVRDLANSMKTEGFYKHCALAGFVAMEDGEKVIYVYAGHSRLLAVDLANSEGSSIHLIPMSVDQDGLSMDDMNIGLIRENNSSMPLTSYEVGKTCKRLLRDGMPMSELVERSNLSEVHINNLMRLMAAPLELRNMVVNNLVAATTAMDIIAEHGSNALAVLRDAMANAGAVGATRITKKHVAGSKHKKLIKKSAPKLYSALAEIRNDPAFAGLGIEIREKLLALLCEIDESKDPEADADGSADANQATLFDDTAHVA